MKSSSHSGKLDKSVTSLEMESVNKPLPALESLELTAEFYQT